MTRQDFTSNINYYSELIDFNLTSDFIRYKQEVLLKADLLDVRDEEDTKDENEEVTKDDNSIMERLMEFLEV